MSRKPALPPPPDLHDWHLWEQVKASVTPLQTAKKAVRTAKSSNETAGPPLPAPLPQKPRANPAPAVTKPPMIAASAVPASAASLDRVTRRNIKRARLVLEDQLDLHGYKQEGAHAALEHFLQKAQARQHRFVLVITGKSGVLRRLVPEWLRSGALTRWVNAFSVAEERHGGSGALYLRLRKKT